MRYSSYRNGAGCIQYNPKTKCGKGYFTANRSDRYRKESVQYKSEGTKDTAGKEDLFFNPSCPRHGTRRSWQSPDHQHYSRHLSWSSKHYELVQRYLCAVLEPKEPFWSSLTFQHLAER